MLTIKATVFILVTFVSTPIFQDCKKPAAVKSSLCFDDALVQSALFMSTKAMYNKYTAPAIVAMREKLGYLPTSAASPITEDDENISPTMAIPTDAPIPAVAELDDADLLTKRKLGPGLITAKI